MGGENKANIPAGVKSTETVYTVIRYHELLQWAVYV